MSPYKFRESDCNYSSVVNLDFVMNFINNLTHMGPAVTNIETEFHLKQQKELFHGNCLIKTETCSASAIQLFFTFL
jgi:hypothetical protein